MPNVIRFLLFTSTLLLVLFSLTAKVQGPPAPENQTGYTGLFAAASRGDAALIRTLVGKGESVDARDAHGRTPLHVASFAGHHEATRALVSGGADANALENDRYDIITIAAVANDAATLGVALTLGCNAEKITSPYEVTALIAAAHLGHRKVVQMLVHAGAPWIMFTISVGQQSQKQLYWVTAGPTILQPSGSSCRAAQTSTWLTEMAGHR